MSKAVCSLLLLLFAPLGCVVLPIPVPERKVLAGHRITGENTASIESGVTTRSDVIRQLGLPTIDLKDQRIIAYSWEMLKFYMPWAIGGAGAAAGGVERVGKPYDLLIAFDTNDRVLRFGTKVRTTSRLTFDTVLGHALKWAKHEGLEIPKPPSEFVAWEIPTGQSVLYIYRVRWGWDDIYRLDGARFSPPSTVTIDGEVVAELRRGGYMVAALSPGSHTISVNAYPIYPAHPFNPWSLNPGQGPIRSFSFEALPDTAYYLEVKVRQSGGLYPVLTMRSAEAAMPVIKRLKGTW